MGYIRNDFIGWFVSINGWLINWERAHEWRPAELICQHVLTAHSVATTTFSHNSLEIQSKLRCCASHCSCCGSFSLRRACSCCNISKRQNATKHRELLTWKSADESRERIEHIKHHTHDHVSQDNRNKLYSCRWT